MTFLIGNRAFYSYSFARKSFNIVVIDMYTKMFHEKQVLVQETAIRLQLRQIEVFRVKTR